MSTQEFQLTLQVQQHAGRTSLKLASLKTEGPVGAVRFERLEELLRYLKALTEPGGLR